MSERKTRHVILRENLRDSCEDYWRAIAQSGWSAEHVNGIREKLSANALRLYLFEQGMNAEKRTRR